MEPLTRAARIAGRLHQVGTASTSARATPVVRAALSVTGVRDLSDTQTDVVAITAEASAAGLSAVCHLGAVSETVANRRPWDLMALGTGAACFRRVGVASAAAPGGSAVLTVILRGPPA